MRVVGVNGLRAEGGDMRKGKLNDGRAAWFHGVFPCGDDQLQAPVVVVELEGGAMVSVDVDKFTFGEPAQAQATATNMPSAEIATRLMRAADSIDPVLDASSLRAVMRECACQLRT